MIWILPGVAILVGTGVLFWFWLPRQNRHPLVTSKEIARYVPLLIIAGVAFGLGLIFQGASH